MCRATLSTPQGRIICRGTLELRDEAGGWRGDLRHVDRPGDLTRAYFCEGIRDVTVRLGDGRRSRGRITATSFSASAERVCALAGAPFLT